MFVCLRVVCFGLFFFTRVVYMSVFVVIVLFVLCHIPWPLPGLCLICLFRVLVLFMYVFGRVVRCLGRVRINCFCFVL